ncbi:N-acetylglucosamine kinase-like BadF-type ATPase [Virgibacillus natechei]|uniref:N-acetylglucosamine kinase-like BadF-type ATPase n=1 Tax=Virgibacillus natechei TaxID=1216297 RepID=A0ABS4IKV4_9BACI|nr:BadF/BadG/BcrA/BcrD ATPase family protein [Virgibacillus natechei]MBP1971549.1 N-acetylglucosamine kinase-like BadF-type ATPase [Virgibacillus natechei]UZD11981.1 ATPase [Virgibacillus natechei]
MRYILGVDGGNSKTYAVIVDEKGNRIGHGISGNGNHQGVGVDRFLENIQSAVDQALNEGGLQSGDISFAQFGLAGADREKDYKILKASLAKLPFENWDVVSDALEGIRAGSPTNTGVVLVCGAGTNAAGKTKNGKTVQTGGFGYRFGDGAGGAFMADEAFRAAIRSWEYRGERTLLTEMIPRELGYQNIEELYNYYIDNLNEKVPFEVTLILHRAADKGDLVAMNILKKVGWELGIAANSVIKRLGGFDGETIPIILVGSVLQEGKNPALFEMLKKTIQDENADYELINLEMEPVYGSVLLAMDKLSIEADDTILNKFISYGGYQS